MTAENLRWLENVFRQTVGENGEIRLQDFKNIVHSKNVSSKIAALLQVNNKAENCTSMSEKKSVGGKLQDLFALLSDD